MSVAATYAEALYEAAEAQSAVDQVRTELTEFAGAMAPGTELREALTSPEIETTAKRAAAADLMEGAHPVSLGFVQVLLDRGRIAEIDDVIAAYGRRVDAAAQGRGDGAGRRGHPEDHPGHEGGRHDGQRSPDQLLGLEGQLSRLQAQADGDGRAQRDHESDPEPDPRQQVTAIFPPC